MEMKENDIYFKIREAITKVFNSLGPGLQKSVYENVLFYELCKMGFNVKSQFPLPIIYDNTKLEDSYTVDLLIDNRVVLTIRTDEIITETHHQEINTYLKLCDKKLGVMVNFNTADIEQSIYVKVMG